MARRDTRSIAEHAMDVATAALFELDGSDAELFSIRDLEERFANDGGPLTRSEIAALRSVKMGDHLELYGLGGHTVRRVG